MRNARLCALLLATIAAIVPVRAPAALAACPGVDEGAGSRIAVVQGSFHRALQGSYVLVPFTVPPGSTRVRVKICFDQPDIPIAVPGVVSVRNTLDLGIYQPRPAGDTIFDGNEFRGWGGSSRPNVLITSEAAPTQSDTATGTTVGFKPGPIPPGVWAAEIGIAGIAGLTEGNLDSSVAWRLDVFAASLASDLDDPWAPTPYDETPAAAGPGWYKGDFHVHAEHSNPSDASMRETFDYAFGSPAKGKAGLDFITLSDYVTDRHWDEIGRFQPDYPGKLIIRSSEVITYRGHINNHASGGYVDYRTGPIFERRPNGSLRPIRGAQGAKRIFRDIHAPRDEENRRRGWTQVNHPTIFPSQVPAFALFCRGCSWSYSNAETDWSQVDAFEVATGPGGLSQPEENEPGPNPFTVLAIEWYDRLRRAGYDITAVGSSDSHRAGSPTNPVTQSPIGEATTVVYAPELSERGIRDGILAGHAYVKLFSPSGPDLRFTARNATAGPVIMGDTLVGTPATFAARVLGAAPDPQPRVLLVMFNGLPILAFPVLSNDQTFTFPGLHSGDYRLQLMRGTAIEVLTNPITVALQVN